MENSFETDPILKGLLQGFVSRLPERAQAINDAASNGEWDKVNRLAHMLNGTAYSYGLDPIGQCAAKIELLGFTNSSDPKIMPLIQHLQVLVSAL